MFPVQYIMELTFTQAAKGVNKEIVVNIQDSCVRCDGKGHEPGTKAQRCHYCNGTGMVSAGQDISSALLSLLEDSCFIPWWKILTTLISLSQVKLS